MKMGLNLLMLAFNLLKCKFVLEVQAHSFMYVMMIHSALHDTFLTWTLEHQSDKFFCQFYFGNKLLSMAAMEGVEGIPVLFVAWNQPDVFRLGTSFKFQTLVRNCLDAKGNTAFSSRRVF